MINFPRRNQIQLRVPAEQKIAEAIEAVEKIGAHPKLTEAVMTLQKAMDTVGDYVDAVGKLSEASSGVYRTLEDVLFTRNKRILILSRTRQGSRGIFEEFSGDISYHFGGVLAHAQILEGARVDFRGIGEAETLRGRSYDVIYADCEGFTTEERRKLSSTVLLWFPNAKIIIANE